MFVPWHSLSSSARWIGVGLIGLGLVVGCDQPKKKRNDTDKPAIKSVYPTLPPVADLPEFMKGTIYELAQTMDIEPLVVSGYGLVADLYDTGDSTVPMVVREYILRDMLKRGIPQAQRILDDKRVAIVQVDATMPPGIRSGQQFDAQVSAIAGSLVTSLTHGQLYQCELSEGGANQLSPGNPVAVKARAQGAIFVNPAYALLGKPDPSSQAAASLRYGVILNGAQALVDRPMRLRLRSPQFSMARYVENRIDSKFQSPDTAAAENEAVVSFIVPPRYAGDWDHFRNLVTHLYVDARPQLIPVLGQRLVEAAGKPNAPLLDISYCLEGLGEAAAPFIDTLLGSDDPAVVFASARAGAFVQHQGAIYTLMEMARNEKHPFQLSAVQTLGKLPVSPMIASRLRQLLDSSQEQVRVEAYKTLANHKDPSIITRVVNERFILDLVPGKGEPLIYASRTGLPRIALIGQPTVVAQPVMYSAMNNQFMISTQEDKTLLLYYRGSDAKQPIKMRSGATLAEVLARLGGDGEEGQAMLNFSYSEVLGILQQLTSQGKLVALEASGQELAASLFLQEMPNASGATYSAAVLEAPDASASQALTPEQLPVLRPDSPLNTTVGGVEDNRARPQ
ncbi:MAG: flagellar basal body P-ring protein FlgI [Phycisphaerales bacterium]|nr:flagellar basal body P-ring protein FlgI [Phycisphaerales bacterium]